jgi:hypothetical protein
MCKSRNCQLCAAVLALLSFGSVVPQSRACHFNAGGAMSFGAGVSGRAFGMPGLIPGFRPGVSPLLPGISPLNNLLVNPYGGPVATMTSAAYGADPYLYSTADPYSGYLKGTAAVIDAQGRYLVTVEQAYMAKEELKRAKLANKRAALEEWLWERENLPTLEAERARDAQQQLQRAQNDPPPTELWSGQSLNVLLQSAANLPPQGQGPNIPLDEELLNKINLNTGKGSINFGLLKNEGNLSWPTALLDLKPAGEAQELRDQLQRRAKEALEQAKKGPVDPNTVKELEKSSERLQKLLLAQVGDLPFADYSESKRYLGQLNDGLRALREPNAGDFANGKFKLKAGSVADLIQHMTKHGLKFAPATPGDESAYGALHRALADYSVAVSKLTAEKR